MPAVKPVDMVTAVGAFEALVQHCFVILFQYGIMLVSSVFGVLVKGGFAIG